VGRTEARNANSEEEPSGLKRLSRRQGAGPAWLCHRSRGRSCSCVRC